jgi:transposase
MSLCRQPVAARVPAPWRARERAGSLAAEPARSRLSLEVHDQVFTWVLKRVANHGLIGGERIGVDASTMGANPALRSIVRRDSGEGYREMLTRMAKESRIATPTAEDLVWLDRHRKGRKLI